MPAPEYFPGLEKRLTSVVWKALNGLIYLHFESFWRLEGPTGAIPTNPANTTPRPERYTVRIENLPGVDNFIVNDLIAKKGALVASGGTPPAIVNPVSINMLGYYSVWTPANARPPIDNVITKTVPSSDVWVWDIASYQLVYNHVLTSRVFIPSTRQEAIDYFKGVMPDPSLVGVVIQQNYSPPPPHDFPVPPSEAGWAFVAITPTWHGHMESSGVKTNYGRMNAANLIINVAQVARSMTPAQKTAGEFKFKILFEADSKINANVKLYTIKKVEGQELRKDYPVQDAASLYRPTWTGPDAAFEEIAPGTIPTGAVAEVTVKLKPLTVTVTITGEGTVPEG